MNFSNEQLKQCIIIASNPSSSDAKKATSLLDSFRNEVNVDVAVKHCLELIHHASHKNSPDSTHISFFAWSTIQLCLEYSINITTSFTNQTASQTNSYRGIVSETCRLDIRNMVLNNISSNNIPTEYFFEKKIALVIVLLIIFDFPERWPNAFDEIMSTFLQEASSCNPPMLKVDIYLRVLDDLCDKVVDFYTSGTNETVIQERKTLIKDLVRGLTPSAIINNEEPDPTTTIVYRLVKTILDITNLYKDSTSEESCLAPLALSVFKRFSSWINIKLVLDDSVINLLLSCFKPFTKDGVKTCQDDPEEDVSSALAIQAAECFSEIIQRGMTTNDKLQLFMKINIIPNLIQVHQSNPENGNVANYQEYGIILDEDTNVYVAIKLAELINSTGSEIFVCWEDKDIHQDDEKAKVAGILLQQFFTPFFHCFAYDDIDVTSSVLPVANRFVLSVGKEYKSKQNNQQSSGKFQFFSTLQYIDYLLSLLYQQMKYPSDFQFDYNDDDEADEQAFRFNLRKLYIQMVRTYPIDLTIRFLCQVFANLPMPLSTCPIMSLEASLRLLFHFSEGIRPSTYKSSKSASAYLMNKIDAFHDLVVALYSNSDLVEHSHDEITLLYFDVAVRYLDLFKKHPELLPNLLEIISGTKGLQHPTCSRVRSRSCYLLLRLVQGLSKGGQMKGYVETAVRGIQNLLSNPNLNIQHEDTLYLFETIGLLLGTTGNITDLQVKSQYLAAVISPHMQNIEQILQSPHLQRDPKHYGLQLSQCIAAVSYLSKGFGKLPDESTQSILTSTINTTFLVLQTLPKEEPVRNKSMILIQRMILCLSQDRVLEFVPSFLELLINNCTSEDAINVSQLINQIALKYKEASIPTLSMAIIPFIQKCQALVQELQNESASEVNKNSHSNSFSPAHWEIEQFAIQKLAYSSLQHIASNNVSEALLSSSTLPHLEQVLQLMRQGATTAKDPIVKKTCIVFFKDLSKKWLDEDLNESSPINKSVQNGFLQFVYQSLIPDLFICILESSFNERDAMQARIVSEIASLLIVLKSKRGASEVEFQIANNTVDSINIPQGTIAQILGPETPREAEMNLKIYLKTMKTPKS